MVYEYAVDPSLCCKIDKMCFIMEAFGKDKGRLISEVKKDQWSRMVRKAIKSSDNRPREKHSLIEALRKISKKQKAIFCRNLQIEYSDWLDLTQQAHKIWPYRGILVEQYDGNDDQYLIQDIYLNDNSYWKADTSNSVDRNAAAMVQAVSPFLEVSREVILVDRNFRLENPNGTFADRFKNVLIEFMNCIAHKKYGPSVNKLTYHLGQNKITEINDSVIKNLERLCNKYLKDDIPSGFKLEIALWPWSELHDRFILTEIGVVKFGQGLDESGRGKVILTRLSSDEHSEQWEKFKQKKPDIILSQD